MQKTSQQHAPHGQGVGQTFKPCTSHGMHHTGEQIGQRKGGDEVQQGCRHFVGIGVHVLNGLERHQRNGRKHGHEEHPLAQRAHKCAYHCCADLFVLCKGRKKKRVDKIRISQLSRGISSKEGARQADLLLVPAQQATALPNPIPLPNRLAQHLLYGEKEELCANPFNTQDALDKRKYCRPLGF